MGAIEGRCHCGRAGWRLASPPDRATTCNCTACRRYGALWAYGELGTHTTFTGPTHAYVRDDIEQHLAFHFCPSCGAVVGWKPLDPEGNPRCAVNLRLAEPEAVAALPIIRFDGAGDWAVVPSNGRTVGDVWH